MPVLMENLSHHRILSLGIVSTILAALGLIALAGCDVSVGTISIGSSEPADEETVKVRFVNETSEAVEVQFYATNEQVSNLPGDLFVEDNLVTRGLSGGIGVGGTGVIGPLGLDEVTIECTSRLVLGTLGGRFLDNETGIELGAGTQEYLRSTLTLCGRVVTFIYSHDSDGYFTMIELE